MSNPSTSSTSRRPARARRSALRADGAFLADVLDGLGRRPRALPSRWFYDSRGSRLFQWISRLPGYYLTRVEREILEVQGGAMVASLAGPPCTVVDLGAGDGHKTRLLLGRLAGLVPALTYAPVDVSQAALDEASARVRAELPDVRLHPIRASFQGALRGLAADDGRRLVLFLGSSIGNLEHVEALGFLRELRTALRPGDQALVGFDLVKPLHVLRGAYDDPEGVTRAFNLNLLARINRELGADFDLGAFHHRATWDPVRPAMESWLEAARNLEVHVGGQAFRFQEGERIHTEISCKYREDQVSAFARDAGFAEVATFRDRRRWFADALWEVPG